MARSASESFARLFKGGLRAGAAPLPALRRARNSLFAHKRSGRGFKGETLSRGFLLFSFGLCVCAVTLGGSLCLVLPFDPISLVLAQRNGVEPPKKSAFYPGGSTIRVSATASVDGTHLRPTWGGAGACLWVYTCAPISWEKAAAPYCQFHPISLLLRKETGWSPKETRLWVPPREVLGPARLSHGLEAPTSQPTASS